jgi:hypothetical protein
MCVHVAGPFDTKPLFPHNALLTLWRNLSRRPEMSRHPGMILSIGHKKGFSEQTVKRHQKSTRQRHEETAHSSRKRT